jgi:hypothetical protein
MLFAVRADANEQSHYARVREALRLCLQAGLSYNEVGRAPKSSKRGVGKYVSLAR